MSSSKNPIPQSKSNCIWIINHYASHLEQRHLELGRVFVENGYKVVIVTSSFQHGAHKYMFEDDYVLDKRQEGLYYVYLRTKPAYHDSGVKRVFNMLDFTIKAIRYQKRITLDVGAPSFVIGSSAHPLVWESAYRIARKHNAKFIAEFRDIWPLSLVAVQGMSPKHPLVSFFSIIEKRAYKRADAIVATMPYADKHVCDELGFPRSKFHWMPNGIRVDSIIWDAPIPKELEDFLDSRWCCVYTGSLVKSEYIDFILDAMAELKDEDIHLAIVGEGNQRDNILNRIKELGLEKVTLFPKVHKDAVMSVIKKAKCCVAATGTDSIFKYGLSKYKLIEYLISGVPIAFACSFDNVVRKTKNYHINSGDKKNFAKSILAYRKMSMIDLQLIGESGKSIVRRTYDYCLIGSYYLKMLYRLSKSV